MTDLPVMPVPDTHEAPQSPWARLVGVLLAPVTTFRGIARRPEWLTAAIVIFVISLASVAITVPKLDYEPMREQMEQQQKKNPNMTPEQADKAVRIGMAIGKSVQWASPFFALGWLAVVAAIYLLGTKLAGGEGSYLAAFAITLYAQMPLVIRRLLNDVILLTKKSVVPEQSQMLLRSNLAFLTNLKTNPAGWAALASLDVFAIWSVILLIIGFAEMPRMTRGRSAVVVITIWILFTLFGVGAASLAMLTRKGA